MLPSSHTGRVKTRIQIKVTAQMTHHVTVAGTMIRTISVRLLAAIEIVRVLLHQARDIVAMVVLHVVVTLPPMLLTAATAEMDVVVVAYRLEDETIVNEAQIDLVGATVRVVTRRHYLHQVHEKSSMIVRFRQATSKVFTRNTIPYFHKAEYMPLKSEY